MYLDKTKIPKVAVDFMNNIHYEEVELINQIVEMIDTKDTEGLSAKLDEFLQHTIEHFEIENQHMQTYGFFAYDCHKGEHDRVLYELKNVVSNFKEYKDFDAVGSYFKVTIIDWMVNHISTMDFVTAQFISQFKNNIKI